MCVKIEQQIGQGIWNNQINRTNKPASEMSISYVRAAQELYKILPKIFYSGGIRELVAY
jgi:hypothetical protein